jgi:sugar/nucleoside kinase (ribokinase family)
MQNKYADAAREYERVARQDSDGDLYPWYQASLAYGLSGNETKKQTVLESAVKQNKLSPTYNMTLFELGSSYVQQGNTRYHIGAITTSCTDSTGAGDLYAGGFLLALSDGFDLRRCGEIGTIAAGRVVEIVGTKLSEETWDEIRRICALYRGFMQKYNTI